MIHDIMPGTEEQVKKELTTAYVGIDPTASSLHIGHLASIMLLKHFQLSGHKPIILIGRATGMIGDPSGKSDERTLIPDEILNHNQEELIKQIRKFFDFGNIINSAEIVNNYSWMKEFKFFDFIQDIGKHISINYMMAKDAIKSRLKTGISFTEFSYQLVQAYDFLYLYQNNNCKLQMGGSDQWGNITTGIELIRRKIGKEAFALTCPLIVKPDGSKFGKTESGNVWLDAKLTSSYKFYQFWLNISDEDAEKYIKIFTLLSKERIEELIKEHHKAPDDRTLQKALAKHITIMVHSEEDYNSAVEATQILFGKATAELLGKIDENTFLDVFEGVPQFEVKFKEIEKGVNVIELLSIKTSIFESKGEVRRLIAGGGLSMNKEKINSADEIISNNNLINGKYILVQKGKKNYFLIKLI